MPSGDVGHNDQRKRARDAVVDECVREVQRRRQDVLRKVIRARRMSGANTVEGGVARVGGDPGPSLAVGARGSIEQRTVLKRIIDEELEKQHQGKEKAMRVGNVEGGTDQGPCSGGSQRVGHDPQAASGTRLSVLTDEEYMELILRMEEELYNDMEAMDGYGMDACEEEEELEYLNELENAEIDAMVEAHFAGDMEHMADTAAGYGRGGGGWGPLPPVMCPVCRNHALQTHGNDCMFYCPEGHLAMDTSMEGIPLEQVGYRIRACERAHAEVQKGCMGTVRFEMRDGTVPAAMTATPTTATPTTATPTTATLTKAITAITAITSDHGPSSAMAGGCCQGPNDGQHGGLHRRMLLALCDVCGWWEICL